MMGQKEWSKRWYEKLKAEPERLSRFNAIKKRWSETHPGLRLRIGREYYAKNKERLKEYHRIWCNAHKGRVKQYSWCWRKRNPWYQVYQTTRLRAKRGKVLFFLSGPDVRMMLNGRVGIIERIDPTQPYMNGNVRVLPREP